MRGWCDEGLCVLWLGVPDGPEWLRTESVSVLSGPNASKSLH